MSQNCIQCVKNKWTFSDLLCDACRASNKYKQPHRCQFNEGTGYQCDKDAVWVNDDPKATGYAGPRYRCNAHTQGGNRISDGKPIAEVMMEGAGQPDSNGGWTQQVPTEQAAYWWWNGDNDSAPIHLNVLWSGTDRKCFVSMGQYGFTDAKNCDECGGWWKPLPVPEPPKV